MKKRQPASPDSLFEGVLLNKTKIRKIIRNVAITFAIAAALMIVNNIFDIIPIRAF